MNKIIAPVIVVAMFATILYYVSAAVTADVIDEPLRAGLSTGEIPGLTAAVYIIASQVAVLALAFFLTVIAVYRDGRVAGIALVSIPAGFLALVLVSVVALTTFPGFRVTLQNWYLLPVLFDIYVLRNPGLGVAIQGILFVAMLLLLMKSSGVMERVRS